MVKVKLGLITRVFLGLNVVTFTARVRTKALMFNASQFFRITLDSNAWNRIDNPLPQIDPFHFSKAKLSLSYCLSNRQPCN